jgi:carboxymethylenebutenolidase
MMKKTFSAFAFITALAVISSASACGGKPAAQPLAEAPPPTATTTSATPQAQTTAAQTTAAPTTAATTAPATATTSAPPTQTSTASTPATSPVTTSSTTAGIVTINWTPPSGPVTLTLHEAANRATYKSGATDISGYFYKPQGSGPFPTVLVLHGRGGLTQQQRDYALWLAQHGYVAFAPDYFAPISMPAATWASSDYGKYQDRIRADLGMAVEALKSLQTVAANRIAVAGFSLGGYFAFWLGTRDDIRGVVSYYGAYAPTVIAKYGIKDIVAQMKAPVIMYHGDKDTMVPIEQANTVRDLLSTYNKQYEYIVYPGAEHAFGPQYTSGPNATANTDSQQKTLAFLAAKMP